MINFTLYFYDFIFVLFVNYNEVFSIRAIKKLFTIKIKTILFISFTSSQVKTEYKRQNNIYNYNHPQNIFHFQRTTTTNLYMKLLY